MLRHQKSRSLRSSSSKIPTKSTSHSTTLSTLRKPLRKTKPLVSPLLNHTTHKATIATIATPCLRTFQHGTPSTKTTTTTTTPAFPRAKQQLQQPSQQFLLNIPITNTLPLFTTTTPFFSTKTTTAKDTTTTKPKKTTQKKSAKATAAPAADSATPTTTTTTITTLSENQGDTESAAGEKEEEKEEEKEDVDEDKQGKDAGLSFDMKASKIKQPPPNQLVMTEEPMERYYIVGVDKDPKFLATIDAFKALCARYPREMDIIENGPHNGYQAPATVPLADIAGHTTLPSGPVNKTPHQFTVHFSTYTPIAYDTRRIEILQSLNLSQHAHKSTVTGFTCHSAVMPPDGQLVVRSGIDRVVLPTVFLGDHNDVINHLTLRISRIGLYPNARDVVADAVSRLGPVRNADGRNVKGQVLLSTTPTAAQMSGSPVFLQQPQSTITQHVRFFKPFFQVLPDSVAMNETQTEGDINHAIGKNLFNLDKKNTYTSNNQWTNYVRHKYQNKLEVTPKWSNLSDYY